MTNALTRWNPLRELEDFQNRVLSAFAPGSPNRSNGKEALPMAEWSPLADVAEDDEGYLIIAELPEVEKKDVAVTVENGLLTIAGERKAPNQEGKNRKWHRVERAYGTFARTFSLPDDGDAAKVSAEFKDGMLSIRIAKRETARPKQIEIKAG